jgi:hypothetical protein
LSIQKVIGDVVYPQQTEINRTVAEPTVIEKTGPG